MSSLAFQFTIHIRMLCCTDLSFTWLAISFAGWLVVFMPKYLLNSDWFECLLCFDSVLILKFINKTRMIIIFIFGFHHIQFSQQRRREELLQQQHVMIMISYRDTQSCPSQLYQIYQDQDLSGFVRHFSQLITITN